jgi:CubicO group peptidase (beta-lactamase class C family)
MNFETMQKAWQSQDAAAKVTINADVLLKEVRRNQQCFRRTIFWRDVREVSVAAVLVPIFIAGGLKVSWVLYLCALGCFVVGAYFVIDRRRQKKTTPDLHGSLKDCAATSLAEVSHQIWLLKNVLWWYLLPIFVPIMLFFGWVTWQLPVPITTKILRLLPHTSFVVLLYAGIYWLNQFAVKKNLEPRRQELEKLLAGLETENHPSPMKTKKPLGPLLLVLAVSAIAVIAHADMKAKPAASIGAIPATGIGAICNKHNLPALAVVVVKDGQICDRDAVGVRKSGDSTPVTTNDVFHIGSCTKSMTATLTALLIEEGKLNWNTTIADVFPELKGKMDKQYETVTVEQLLHHRGGVPGEPPGAAWKRAWEEKGTPTQQRREFIEAVLSQPPETAPGTKMIYSNQGYAIVGAMLEKLTGTNYEALITEKLFKPLHMDSAGFGPPGTTDKVDQPWGHLHKLFMTLPVQSDNPPAIAPAGRVHCSLDDLARFAMLHLQGHATNGLLKPESLTRLHTPTKGGDYACGWVVLQRGWAGGTALMHNGSNSMWYIVMWLAPEKDFAVIAATNIAGPDAEQGCDDACVAMIHKWLPE